MYFKIEFNFNIVSRVFICAVIARTETLFILYFNLFVCLFIYLIVCAYYFCIVIVNFLNCLVNC